ncbi:MAG TPA: hypothetical protein VEB21_15885 [Terriglobales bacterium]|nr:hypothetical protein [Terriglobales bacterium]
MSGFEVEQPILCSPFCEPSEYWQIREGEPPRRIAGRRPAVYFYRPPSKAGEDSPAGDVGTAIELKIVNRIRARLAEWRVQNRPGASALTRELLEYWQREGRRQRLFFAQIEAAETIIFLKEARGDLLQGIDVPKDEPSDEWKAKGYRGFPRYACKMATGSGKTTVMAMLAAWSILNKINDRGNASFSDVVLVVCPNVTIRSRLTELDPNLGEASLYRTRDLVPPHLMPSLTQGRVLVTNWHVFEPQTPQAGGVGSKVIKTGVEIRHRETITIAATSATTGGRRYLTADDLNRQASAGLLNIVDQKLDAQGNLKQVQVETVRYVESDTALVNRILGREVGGKQNVLVFNDEAHHAYRLRHDQADFGTPVDEDDEDDFGREYRKEATVWIEGLDRIHRLRGINFCVDLSATPYFLSGAGQETNRIFPWTVSDFGLTDAIESGLVKIPQLAVRDTSGAPIPGYFNIWRWILPHLTGPEKGGKKGSIKPEAILKWAHSPIAMLGGLWEELRYEWQRQSEDPRPPVFILVCKNTKLAKVVFDWLAENQPPPGIPPADLPGFRNGDNAIYTIRVDSKVVEETDSDNAKSDQSAWMRFTLDTVGRMDWPRDAIGRPIYPDRFEALARKLQRSLHPPGRDVRCIVSVGMLTEGWDCNTVTHIVGLRPFLSQLLCEQVVGRGLRRTSYEIGEDGRLSEEVAKVFGVPFQVIPFKENKGTKAVPPPKRHHIHAVPEKAALEIRYPRVEGYVQSIRSVVTVDWSRIAPLDLDPQNIPPEVQMKAALPNNLGRPSLTGPGSLETVDLNPYRSSHRFQKLVFELAGSLTRDCVEHSSCEGPAHVLFPQLVAIVDRYLREKVRPIPPAQMLDAFLSPYYGWVIERLTQAIDADPNRGDTVERPRYEANRGPGSTLEVDFWTSRDVREVRSSHLNFAVADTKRWEQSATYILDTDERVEAFAKNSGLGFAIPYLHNGQAHDYVPDFLVRLAGEPTVHLILETKGYDPLEDIKRQAAERWVAAVNAEGSYGQWRYAIAKKISDIPQLLRV